MFIGTIRSTQTREIEVAAATLAEARAQTEARVPAGWTLTGASVSSKAGAEGINITAKVANWADVRHIEAVDTAALRANVPEGYQLIAIRRA